MTVRGEKPNVNWQNKNLKNANDDCSNIETYSRLVLFVIGGDIIHLRAKTTLLQRLGA